MLTLLLWLLIGTVVGFAVVFIPIEIHHRIVDGRASRKWWAEWEETKLNHRRQWESDMKDHPYFNNLG